MKLTEKELNEFPIGAKILTKANVFIKTGYGLYAKYNTTECFWENKEMISFEIESVEIPTYTEYIPPQQILDDKEKEYLSYIIRPWRNRVKYIRKNKGIAKEYINIQADGIVSVTLPYFKAGTMYKGMELDREYSLEDLRIVR